MECKGQTYKTAIILFCTVFYPTLCKTPDAPLQNELLS